VRRSQGVDFNELYAEYWPRVYAFCRRLGAGAADAEDLTQEVFVLVYRHLHQLRAAEAARTWIFRIAVRQWRRRLITARQQPLPLNEDLAAPYLRTDPRAECEASVVLHHALAQLSEPLREAVILTKLDGLTSAEAGRILEISENTVRWRVYEAMKQLNRLFTAASPNESSEDVTAAPQGDGR
jgi:RNA polymerase sigma-70 factor (ECF subfamily)